ncbi:hypothetical protein Moror_12098 [Moniliophthora roreri MCA 2997]|nr:hypothetical protein Moror_12098 [Moniliophthora roreri MCA 2997]
MSTTIPEDLIRSLFSVQETIVRPIATLSAMFFVYGFYVLLFGTYVYMMCSDHKESERFRRNLNLALAVVLFGLSTASIVVYTTNVVDQSIALFTAVKTQDYQSIAGYLTQNGANIAFQYLVPILLNIAAEYILAHTPLLCDLEFRETRYLTFNSSLSLDKQCVNISSSLSLVLRRKIGLVSVAGVAAATMLTISVNDSSGTLYYLYFVGNNVNFAHAVASIVVNSTLTLLTAGRIWWVHRQVRALGVSASDTFVQSVSRIILESGLLYPVMSIAGLIMANTMPFGVMPFDFYPLVVLSAGIAPTLTMVRVKLGRNIETLQDQVSDIHFTSRQVPLESISTRSQAQVRSVVNISMGQVDTAIIDGKETIVV